MGDDDLAIKPRMTATMSHAEKYAGLWPQPNITASIDGYKVCIPNDTDEPIVSQNEHFGQAHTVLEMCDNNSIMANNCVHKAKRPSFLCSAVKSSSTQIAYCSHSSLCSRCMIQSLTPTSQVRMVQLASLRQLLR